MRTLELLGSNIANINTIGYKSSRMTFLESLGQVVDVEFTPFTQGDLGATGIATDLAIRGESFFILDNGTSSYFTRAGAFYFDEAGKLVNSDGYAVQGWMTNVNGASEVETTANLEDIRLDTYLKAEAMATENIWLSGNLSSSLSPKNQVWTAGFPFTTAGDIPALETDDLNSLQETTTPLISGDEIIVSGMTTDGTTVHETFTYGVDGTTLGDFIAVINNGYSGYAQATLTDGAITLSDDHSGESETTINMSLGEFNTGAISIPYFAETSKGFTGTASTSAIMYDTLGESHNLIFNFEKTENLGEWVWSVSTTGDETIDPLNSTGKIYFDESGQVTSFVYDNGFSDIELNPNNSASALNLQVFVNGGDGISGITQFDSTSTLAVRDVDGRSTGELTGYEIQEDGSLMGTFSNGVSTKLAQIAVAEFTNPSALTKVSGSNFQESIKSGKASIGNSEEFSSTIESGYLEMSNVDIADQFSQIIEAQRAFSSFVSCACNTQSGYPGIHQTGIIG